MTGVPLRGGLRIGASGGKEGIESIADPGPQGCGLKVWMGGSAPTEKAPHCAGCWCREMPMGQPGRSRAASSLVFCWGGGK